MRPRKFAQSFADKKREVRRSIAFMTPDGQIPPELAKHMPTVAAKRMRVKHEREGLSELQEQIRVVTWFDKFCGNFGLPPYALIAIPNGGSRGVYEGANLKRSGVRAGAEDLMLTAARSGYHGLFIEMKIKDGGRISPEQHAMAEFHFAQGYQSHVCWNNAEAIEVIQDYLQPRI